LVINRNIRNDCTFVGDVDHFSLEAMMKKEIRIGTFLFRCKLLLLEDMRHIVQYIPVATYPAHNASHVSYYASFRSPICVCVK
jgi:hypothetical protein